MPTLCKIIRHANPSLQGYYLGQLAFLVRAIRGHIRGCVSDIIALIQDVWDTLAQRLPLVTLIEALADALALEFGPYMPGLLPKLLPILQEDKTETLAAIQLKTLVALTALASNLHDYLNLVIPIIVSCYECPRTPFILRKEAIRCLTNLSNTVELNPYTSRIVHSLIPLLGELDEPLHEVVVDALRSLTYSLGASLVIFIPTLTKVRK
jgi:serine/threonine-protein kinase mTOR